MTYGFKSRLAHHVKGGFMITVFRYHKREGLVKNLSLFVYDNFCWHSEHQQEHYHKL